MRSGTSFFDWTLFKKNVTRFWPIWASYLTIWIFVMPVNFLMMDINNAGGLEIVDIASASWAHLWFSLFYGCFSAMAVLSHLYSPRSANFYGTLPVRREGIFLTQYLAGLSFVVVPNILVAALTLLTFAGTPGALGAVLVWLTVGCGVYFFFYTLAVLCGMLVGHILALPAFYAAVNCLAYIVTALIDAVMNEMYKTYMGPGSLVTGAVEWLTPASKLNRNMYTLRQVGEAGHLYHQVLFNENALILAAYVGAGAVMALAAFLLYRARRTESAGDVVAVRFMRPVFKYGFAVCCGLGLGFMTGIILGEGTLSMNIVVWTALGCFFAQMILDKSFRVFKKWKGALAVTAVMAAVLAVMAFDLTGFDTWIPKLEDVESVKVTGLGTASYMNDSADWQTVTLTDPEHIEKILEIHREGVKGERPGSMRVSLGLVYHTKRGDVSRTVSFSLDPADAGTPGTAAHAFEELYADRELYWRLYNFDGFEAALREEIGAGKPTIYYSNNNGLAEEFGDILDRDVYVDKYLTTIDITSRANMEKLFAAVKEDFFDGNICVRHVELQGDYTKEMSLAFEWESPDNKMTATGPYDDYGVAYFQRMEVGIPSTAVKTLAVLKEILPQELELHGYTTEG